MQTTDIKFSYFNHRRRLRGADAASFDVTVEDGTIHWLWMSETDIKKNILQFPEFRAELEKGLKCYRSFFSH
jgi:hypothetical protein